MALFSMTYDLRRKKEHDYQKLYDKLKEFNAVRVLESTWYFKRVDTTAKGLREYLQDFVHGDDGIFVTEISDWSSYGALAPPPP